MQTFRRTIFSEYQSKKLWLEQESAECKNMKL